MSVPKDLRYDMARAKGYLQKNDVPSALESVSTALRFMSSHHVHSVATVEREINALLDSISLQPAMQFLLDPHGSGKPRNITYQYGKEGALVTVLREFAKILRDQNQAREEHQVERDRLQDLLQKGLSLMEEGQLGTGASFLQRAAREYPHDISTIISIGHALLHYKQYATAAKMYADSLKHHPKQKDFYSRAIHAYAQEENYADAIYVFHRALQQFGRHPRSIAKLAELYLQWEKEEEAELLAKEALEMHPEEELAHKILLVVEDIKDQREWEALEEVRRHQEALERERLDQEHLEQERLEQEKLTLENLELQNSKPEQQIQGSANTKQLQLEHQASLSDTKLTPSGIPPNTPAPNFADPASQSIHALQFPTSDTETMKNGLSEQEAAPSSAKLTPVQGLAQDVLLSFQDIERKKR